MKWMGWGPEDLYVASPEMVAEIITLINEEAAEIEKGR